MTAHLSTLTLHKLRYGELQASELQQARAHLEGCARCSARLAVQERERAAFVLQPVPEAIRRAPRSRWPRWVYDLTPFLVAAAAAAVLFVAVPAVRDATTPPDVTQTVRTKGELPEVEVWVDTGRGARPMRPGERLKAGDRLQLKYDPRGASHVAFAGRDGAGLVEVYGTLTVEGRGLQAAPFGLQLDGTPGDQELFVVTSDRPLTRAAVKAALQRRVPGVRVVAATVHKQEGTR